MSEILRDVFISHLTRSVLPHYLVKCRSPIFAVNNDYVVSIMEVLRQPLPITRSSDPVKSAGRPSCPVFDLKFSVKTSRSVTFQFLVIKIVSLKEDSILITKY